MGKRMVELGNTSSFSFNIHFDWIGNLCSDRVFWLIFPMQHWLESANPCEITWSIYRKNWGLGWGKAI